MHFISGENVKAIEVDINKICRKKKRKIESVKQKIKPKEMKRTYFKGRC